MMKKVLPILLTLALSTIIANHTPAAAMVEGRGLWIDANSIPTDDESMSTFVEGLAAANINILLPESIRRGYTIYPSKLDEQDPKFKGYDPLAALVKEAHARGMEVHPWVWVFRQGYSQEIGPIFRAHPDWMAVNKWGQTVSGNSGCWVCPSIPEAKDYLVSLFKELAANYDIDGLHLDYIRFENQLPVPYCYNDSCRDKFRIEYGMDPMNIDPLSEDQITWHLWREELVNSFVRRISEEVRAVRPGIIISAAVGSMPDQSREKLLQDWRHWVDNKWIDFAAPMSYTGNMESYRKMLSAEKDAVDNRTILMPGIGLHTQSSSDIALEQIRLVREMNGCGITFFAAVYFKDDLKKMLADGLFAEKAELPFRNADDRVKTLIDSAAEKHKEEPADAALSLRKAAGLLDYINYRSSDTGYISPTRPPIYIPEKAQPIPTVIVPKVRTAPGIDGTLNEPVWSTAARIEIAGTDMGGDAPIKTEVKLAYDDMNLYIAYTAFEPDADSIKAVVTKRDGPVFYDDSAEVFLDPWGKRQDYYQLAVNTLGTLFDAKIINSGVNLDWQAAAKRSADGWTAEMAVPYTALGVNPPKPGETWHANFARNRWTSGKPEYLIWSVPYGSFHKPDRFGVIMFGGTSNAECGMRNEAPMSAVLRTADQSGVRRTSDITGHHDGMGHGNTDP